MSKLYRQKKYFFKKNKQNYYKTPPNRLYVVSTLFFFAWYIVLIPMIVITVLDFRKTKKCKDFLFSGLALLISSSFFLSYFALSITAADQSPTMFVLWILAWGASWIFGIIHLILYAIQKKRNHVLEMIEMLVGREHITSVEYISEIIGFDNQKTIRYIKKLIKAGILSGAYIEDGNNEIQFTQSIWAKQRAECLNCGAEIIVNLGQTLICDYCGSKLHIKIIQHNEAG